MRFVWRQVAGFSSSHGRWNEIETGASLHMHVCVCVCVCNWNETKGKLHKLPERSLVFSTIYKSFFFKNKKNKIKSFSIWSGRQ